LDIEIGEVARNDLERFNRLRRIAALVAKTLDTPTQLSNPVLGFCDSAGNSYKSLAVTVHCAPSVHDGCSGYRLYVSTRRKFCVNPKTAGADATTGAAMAGGGSAEAMASMQKFNRQAVGREEVQ
jgi:hypothetical protein